MKASWSTGGARSAAALRATIDVIGSVGRSCSRFRRRCLPLASRHQPIVGGRPRDGRRRRLAPCDRPLQDTGFFNYTDYDHSALRLFRVDLTAAVKAESALRACSARSATRTSTRRAPYALYAPHPAVDRRAPSTSRSDACRRPSAPFARRTYATDNLLIGYPLAYQYLTSLRPDSLPASADELLRMRGRGWLSNFSIGNQTPDARRAARQRVPLGHRRPGPRRDRTSSTAPSSVTTGTLSNPLVTRRQSAASRSPARVALHPVAGPHHRRVGRARAVRLERRRRAAPSATATTSVHADGVGRRRRVLARLLSGARRDDRAATGRSRRIGAPFIDAAAARAVDVGRRPLQDCVRASTPPRASIISASATSSARSGTETLGRAGHARGDRRRLFAAAQPAAEGLVSARHARRRTRARTSTLPAAQIVFWF